MLISNFVIVWDLKQKAIIFGVKFRFAKIKSINVYMCVCYVGSGVVSTAHAADEPPSLVLPHDQCAAALSSSHV